jgi:hypothetical protein
MIFPSLGLYALFCEKTYVFSVEHIDNREQKTMKASNEYKFSEILSDIKRRNLLWQIINSLY